MYTEHPLTVLHVTYRGPWVMSTHDGLYLFVTPTNTKQNMLLYYKVFGKVFKFVACWFFSKLKVQALNYNPLTNVTKRGQSFVTSKKWTTKSSFVAPMSTPPKVSTKRCRQRSKLAQKSDTDYWRMRRCVHFISRIPSVGINYNTIHYE